MRLRGSEPRAVIAERESLERAAALGFDGVAIDVDRDLDALLAAASPDFTAAATTPGHARAARLHLRARPGRRRARCTATASWPATCPGFELSHDFFPQPGDRIWTPADWAWIGGLYDVVMPGLAHGVPSSRSARRGSIPRWRST